MLSRTWLRIEKEKSMMLFRGMHATSIICNQYDDKKSMMLREKINANALDSHSHAITVAHT